MDNQPMIVLRFSRSLNGPAGNADLKQAFIKRAIGEKIPVDLVALLYEGDNRYNYSLEHNDLFVIPRTREDRIFVTGEVDKPHMIETLFYGILFNGLLDGNWCFF